MVLNQVQHQYKPKINRLLDQKEINVLHVYHLLITFLIQKKKQKQNLHQLKQNNHCIILAKQI